MNEFFFVTAAVSVFGILVHGYLGERLVLIPLAHQGVPSTRLGDAGRTMLMIRSAWHVLSVVLLSLAVVFLGLGTELIGGGDWTVVRVLAAYYAALAVLVLVLSWGQSIAWLGPLTAAVTAWLGTL